MEASYRFPAPHSNLLLIVGHYGTGKTNVAVNLAMQLAESGAEVTLADLDIVNPYFRAADNAGELRKLGVNVIVPEYANSNVDIPSVPPEIQSIFVSLREKPSGTAILDIGGDDAGATALGFYRNLIGDLPYDMYCILNCYRPLTKSPEDAAQMLRDIEIASRLRCTGLVNNSNLGTATDAACISASFAFADAVAEKTGIPLIADTAAADYLSPDALGQLSSGRRLFVMQNITKNIYDRRS